MELNLESVNASGDDSSFSLDSDKQYILNHSFRSEFSFHLASGQRLDDILNNWLLVVYDAN